VDNLIVALVIGVHVAAFWSFGPEVKTDQNSFCRPQVVLSCGGDLILGAKNTSTSLTSETGPPRLLSVAAAN